MQSKNKKQSRIHRLFGIKVKSKLAAAYMDTAVKILIYVVCGALFLGGIYGVVQKIVLPKTESSVNSMFAYESAENGNGGAGGSGGVEAPDVIEENDVISGEHITYRFSNTNSGDASGYVELDKVGNYTFYWANEDGILSDWTELATINNSDTLLIDSRTLIPDEATELVVYEGSEQYTKIEIPEHKRLSNQVADFAFFSTGDFHQGATDENVEYYQTSFLTNLQSMRNDVDFCIMNGDIINDPEGENTTQEKENYINKINNYELPTMYYVDGNHDNRTSTPVLNSLNNRSDSETSYFSIEHKGVKFIFAGPDSYSKYGGDNWESDNSLMSNAMLTWLENEINSTPSDTPIYLFTHIPFDKLGCDIGINTGRWPFVNEDEIYDIITKRTNLVSFNAHLHQQIYYNGTKVSKNSIVDNTDSIDGLTVGSIKSGNEFSKFSIYDNGNKIIRTTYHMFSDGSVKKVSNGYVVDFVNNESYNVDNYSIIRDLNSSDISYSKNISEESPYSVSDTTRAIYESFDIPVEYGYTYKFEFTSTSHNAQISYQSITEDGMSLINSNSNLNFETYTDTCKDWNSSGFTYTPAKVINNSSLKCIRLLFRADSNDSPVEDGFITSINISRKINSNLETAILPSEYQQVEYIQSTGTQWIDTGIIANNDTRVKIDFQLTAIKPSFVLGARTTSFSNSYCFNISSAGYWASSFGPVNVDNVLQADTKRHKTHKRNYMTIIDGNLMFSSGKQDAFTTPGSLELFACYNNGTKGYLPSEMKLYSCEIFSGNYSYRTTLRDFVPCYRKSDNIAGLYDTVSGTFFENQGSGDFVAGTPVE